MNEDEIINLLPALIQFGCPLIAITGRPCSRLARTATVHLDTGVCEEADPRGLAPTTRATTTLILGDALALALAEARHFTPDAFVNVPPVRNRRLLRSSPRWTRPAQEVLFATYQDGDG